MRRRISRHTAQILLLDRLLAIEVDILRGRLNLIARRIILGALERFGGKLVHELHKAGVKSEARERICRVMCLVDIGGKLLSVRASDERGDLQIKVLVVIKGYKIMAIAIEILAAEHCLVTASQKQDVALARDEFFSIIKMRKQLTACNKIKASVRAVASP